MPPSPVSDPSWADLGLWGLKLLLSGALPAVGLVPWGPAAVWQPHGAVLGRLVGLGGIWGISHTPPPPGAGKPGIRELQGG